ncbi:YqgQ family protein [Bacillus velezensis]|uniref:YqgQ family protein n=1 Tax=Bacillus amyloliquefaciens group TaxID=1938374 RepID=UPI0003872F9A|nr:MULTISPECIES: YqgQ family protein [Bacillus amyloliquefaciens group]ANB84376.1 hypothetical protein A6R78_10315 [Bacillus velezensis]KOC26493.1 hypothetical protein AC810_06240 [Bacillus velezensis]KOC29550.1 hypothetical protein AC811_02410 [Bacillus velezensis]KYC86724.1 hypothetical protein B4140_2401 [Bacillus amyloliquefaciens]MBC2598541.1 YqgQ family protein [Bacillus velezensis]
MVKKMNSFYDVQQLFKSFGHIVYFGDRQAEIDFMKDELKEMYLSNVIERELWQKAARVLQRESERIKGR